MLKKITLPIVLSSSFLFSQELNNERFQLLAKNIDTKDEIVTAIGDVVVFSPTYYLNAEKIVYNKKNETLELFGDVLVLKDNNIQTQSNYAYLNMKDEFFNQSPVLIFEKENNMWMNSKKALKEKTNIKLEDTIISSCDCVDPSWSIKASSASYDTKNKWIHAYNPRLYIKNVPVFYSPYFGFPTDKTRRTGLLIPTVGYSKNDGIYFSQPIYYAPAHNYDFELIPQIRNKRGHGAYAYFRYADSPYSMLKLKSGFFKEKYAYQKKFNLENNEHFGWNIDYKRTKLFSNYKSQDGLYASINWLNDVEYQTLENDEDISSVEKKVESKINYFYNTPEYYTAAYARFYIDTQKKSNDETLQKLPQLNIHSYNKEIFFNRLIYSIDANYFNYTRKSGLTSSVYEVSLPVSYSKHFFNDYIYVDLANKTTLSKYIYSNGKKNYNNATLLQNESSVSVGTDLIKPYDSYLHTLNFNAKYSYPKNIKKDGDLYKITNDDEDLASFPIIEGRKNIKISLNQSLYDKDNLNQIVRHKLSQSILYDAKNNPKLQNLENYLKFNHSYGSISGRTIYNVEDRQFIENSLNTNFEYKDFHLSAGYYKSKNTLNSNKEDLESYNFKTAYKISRDYKISYFENYNLLDNIRNKQGVSFNINDICWNLDLKFEKEIVPTSSINDKGIKQDVIYINLILKPLGGIKQKYKIKDK